MRIAVCIKQVPDTTKVEIDAETHTLRRAGIESVLNPLDTYAVEQALRIRESLGGEVIAVTMGPPQAEAVLREAMALGTDGGIMVCGGEFAGSDTLATSLALSRALLACGPWDIILCGKQAIDGDTAHVGPELAAHLALPQVTFVRAVREITPCRAVVERLTDTGTEVVATPLPALLTVLKDLNEPRLPNLEDLYRARFSSVPRYRAADLGLEDGQVGLEGSPTRVIDMFSPKTDRKGILFDENYREGFAELLRHAGGRGLLKKGRQASAQNSGSGP